MALDPVDPVAPNDRPRYVPDSQYTLVFDNHVKAKPGLTKFYNPKDLEAIQKEAKVMGDALMDQGCSGEYAAPLSLLKLYDIVMLIDDSSSMNYEQNGERKETLKRTLDQITKVYDLANERGILSLRFINGPQGRKYVNNSKVDDLFKNCKYTGDTRIGTMLEKRVLKRFVLNKTTENPMAKPLLIMVITDGAVEGEPAGVLKHVIVQCMEFLKAKSLDDAVAFHFSRVGDDVPAMRMLDHLDNCVEVGQYVDCLPVDKPLEALSNEKIKWYILSKLLLGAIDPDTDARTLEIGEEVADPTMAEHKPVDDDLDDLE